ncbi:hypothetical protein V4R08_05135 [Nitrobacter sp. NHB1]|uniref:hypothetical protein n=1 Tax=Nitrobacter sp. NHB1 TaxID=3119830 RepID=UPI003000F195
MADDENDQSAESHVTPESQKRASGVFQRIRKRANTLSYLRPFGQIIIVAIACLVLAFALLWLLDKIFYYYLARTYVDQIAQTFDLNPHLANALVLATFFMAVIFGRLIWSLSKTTRRIGVAGFAVLLIGHSILLWYGARGELIDRAGNTIKCYVLSRDGKVTYGEHAGIDPATGRECRPVKPKLVERLQEYAAGKRAQKIDDPNPVFFDPRSGEPIVWYYKSKNGLIELYDLMGFEPNTGEELLPVTKQIAQDWKNQSRRGPRLINAPEKYVFFDPVSGNSQAWYWRNADGSYEFYDAPGFQPQTGEKLNVVTRDVVDDWKRHIAPAHVPQRVDPTKYPFFDLTTGVAQVWYWRAKDGSYEFYDAPGFEPETGEKLSIVTREVVSKWKASLVPPVTAQSSAPAAGPSPANPSVASSGDLDIELRQKTAIFLVNLYAGVSGPNNKVLKEASRNYAERVEYFGKTYTREQVLVELQRSDERWPIRSYRMRADSLAIDCDKDAMTCTATGLLDFDCRSPERSQRSSGAATFGYLLKYSSPKEPPVIVEESGEVKARRIEPLAFNADPQQVVGGQLPQDQEAILRAILSGMFGHIGH